MENNYNDPKAQGAEDQHQKNPQGRDLSGQQPGSENQEQNELENSWSPGQDSDRLTHPVGDQDGSTQNQQPAYGNQQNPQGQQQNQQQSQQQNPQQGSWGQSGDQMGGQTGNDGQNLYGRSTAENQVNPDQQYSGAEADSQDQSMDPGQGSWPEDSNTDQPEQSQRGGASQQNYGSFTNQGVGGNVGSEYDAENQGQKGEEDEDSSGQR